MSAERDPQTYAIIGAAMEVHREKGRGFVEPIYQECMEIELQLRGIPFSREFWTENPLQRTPVEEKVQVRLRVL